MKFSQTQRRQQRGSRMSRKWIGTSLLTSSAFMPLAMISRISIHRLSGRFSDTFESYERRADNFNQGEGVIRFPPQIRLGGTVPDLKVQNEGSVFLLQPYTKEGRDWINENFNHEEIMFYGTALVVEHRYIGDIVEGAIDEGLVVE
jgi:hypothetical protein